MSIDLNHPLARQVVVTEVGTRDGFQAEAAFIPGAIKAEVINAMIDEIGRAHV